MDSFEAGLISALQAFNEKAYIPIDETHSTTNENPEKILIRKDLLRKMPSEFKQVVSVIFTNPTPKEILSKNGTIHKGKLFRYMIDHFGWTWKQALFIKKEMTEYFSYLSYL